MNLAPPVTRVDAYGLDVPTHASCVHALARHLGPADAEHAWSLACQAVFVARHGRSGSSPEALQRVAQYLAKDKSLVGVCASAVNVRLASFMILRREQLQQRRLEEAGAPAER